MSPFWINSFHNKCAMKIWMIGNSKLMKWKTIKMQYCRNSSNMFSVYTRLITGFVTRLIWRVPLVEQELLTLPEHLSSPLVFSEVRVTRSLVLYVCFVDHCLSVCTFLLAIVFSVLLRYADSDYSFGILRIFLSKYCPRVL
jgi:hypothetical protein